MMHMMSSSSSGVPQCQLPPDEPHRKAMLGTHPIYLLGRKPRVGQPFASTPFDVPPARNAGAALAPEHLTEGLVIISTLPNIGKHACATQILDLEEAAAVCLPYTRLCHVSADAPEYWKEVDRYHPKLQAEGYSLFAASAASREAFGRAFGVLVHGHHRIAHGLFALHNGVFIAAETPHQQMQSPQIGSFVERVRRRTAELSLLVATSRLYSSPITTGA